MLYVTIKSYKATATTKKIARRGEHSSSQTVTRNIAQGRGVMKSVLKVIPRLRGHFNILVALQAAGGRHNMPPPPAS